MTQTVIGIDPSKVSFDVYGTPQQVGSKTPLIPKGRDGLPARRANGTVVVCMTDSNKKSKPWMAAVREAAAGATDEGFELFDCPVKVEVEFRFSRPKSHYRTGKHSSELRPDAPKWHSRTPDLDKLLRCLGDSLTSVLLRDDCLIALWVNPRKIWTQGHAGAFVIVEPLA